MQHFLPWRDVWKGNSVRTPCRVVFDASMATSSGYSLNDIFAKGQNNLNNLQEILIRWSTKPTAIHTDITEMYNTIQSKESDWCYQRYLWQDGLELGKLPEEKIVKTLIYGIKSSGNQAECKLGIFAHTDIQITTEGRKHLGAIVRSEEYRDLHIDEKIIGWIDEICSLSKIAQHAPQQACTCFTAGYKHKLNYCMRTIGNIGEKWMTVGSSHEKLDCS